MTLRFCGIGAMRTASTWTFRCLSLHPDIAFPGGKQVHFLDQHLDRGMEWYRGLFAESAPPFDGDITPAYAIVGDDEVAMLADAFDDLRVFFVVRDPIERAWSSARLSIRREELDPISLDTDWYVRRLTRRSVRLRNAYADTYARWKHHFGDRLWLADFAGLQRDPQGFLVALADHIGVNPAVYRAPTPELSAAFTTRLNVAEPLELGPHVDRAAIDDATRAVFAADETWYRAAPVDWPAR